MHAKKSSPSYALEFYNIHVMLGNKKDYCIVLLELTAPQSYLLLSTDKEGTQLRISRITSTLLITLFPSVYNPSTTCREKQQQMKKE